MTNMLQYLGGEYCTVDLCDKWLADNSCELTSIKRRGRLVFGLLNWNKALTQRE